MKVIFLGPPGVGKGTYASRISPQLGIPHISTGDLFREAVKNQTELGLKAKSYIDEGGLVPDELTMEMLEERFAQGDCKNGFILDGFPRTLNQARLLDGMEEIDMVINFILPKDILIEKLSARRTCRNCGDIYNVADINRNGVVMPSVLPKKEGVCDKCGGELYQRDDDKAEVIEKRLGVYEENTKPLIDYYRGKGLLKDVRVVASPEIMVPRIMELMKQSEQR